MIPRVLWTGVAVVSVAYAVAVGVAFGSLPLDAAAVVWVLGIVPGFVGAGVVLLWKRPDDRIGHLLLIAGIIILAIPTILEVLTLVQAEESGAQPWMWFPMWLTTTLQVTAAVVLVRMIVLLPDGRVRYPRERRFLRAAWVLVPLPTLALVSNDVVGTHEQAFVGLTDVGSPWVVAVLRPWGDLFDGLVQAGYLIFVIAIVLQYLRYRRSSLRERKQVRWVLLAGGISSVVLVPVVLEATGIIEPFGHTLAGGLLMSLPILVYPVAVVIAVLEPPWIDVDIVIRRSVVYAVLSALILAVYVAVASAFGVAAGARLDLEVAVLLTVLVAVAFQPVRHRLQALADRWVFGARPTRYEAVAGIGETIERASDPGELLHDLAATVQQTTGARWVEVALDDRSRAVVGQRPDGDVVVAPIGVGGEVVGEVRYVAAPGRPIDADAARLVHTLAAQVGLAVVNARLASRIAQAAETERRRIERNIHDGAQQELVALVARLGVVKAAARNGGVDVRDVEELQREVQGILVELRELAQGIHPSVLTDGGLLEAIEDRCGRLPLPVTLDSPDALRALRFDEQVEGAAYFFVTEALTNVLKHADATRAGVGLAMDEHALRLSVRDDGRGFDASVPGPSGAGDLGDRIRALGGTVAVTSGVGRGTVVSASIPVGS